MEQLTKVMSMLDDVKDKISEGIYLEMCKYLKQISDKKVRRFIRCKVITPFVWIHEKNLDDGDHHMMKEYDSYRYNTEDEHPADITMKLRSDITHHTLEVFDKDDPQSRDVNGVFNFENNKMRLCREEQIEIWKRDTVIKNYSDGKFGHIIYLDEFFVRDE